MKIYRFFGSRHIFCGATVLGILLALPTVFTGFFLDDYQQRIALLTGAYENVFDFFPHSNGWIDAQIQSGVMPWWLSSETKIAFCRPVAQWLMELDYRLWPNSLPLMHLHSVFWYGVLVLIAGLTYRKIMPSHWVAGLAAVLFAVDAAHGGAVAWLANRNALICLASSLLALLCYRQPGLRWQIFGSLFFALSLACSEGALAITGYFFAHELFLSKQRWLQKFLRLLPYAVIASVWIVYWKVGGYGVGGPGWGAGPAYVDPISSPEQFLTTLIYRFPTYLVGQFFFPAVDIFTAVEVAPARFYALAYAVAIVALFAWLFLPLLRRSPLARFYATGMLIAVIPICGSPAFTRSLWFVGFGATGLLALFIEQFRDLPMTPARARWSSKFVTVMLIMHLWLSPLLFIFYSKGDDILEGLMDSHYVQLPNQSGAEKKVLAISTFAYVANITNPLLKDRALSLGTAPTRVPPRITQIRALSEGKGEIELLRKDADTLVVNSKAGMTSLRPPKYGFSAGDKIALNDVEILVKSVSAVGAPTEIEYRFNSGALETYQVIAWEKDHFVPATLPAIGESAHIEIKMRDLF
jgi:hypothetical protein